MNCPNCKNPIQENSSTCEWCGFTINESKSKEYDLDANLLEICKMGKKLSAVIICKEQKKQTLKEAKDYVDRLCLKNGLR